MRFKTEDRMYTVEKAWGESEYFDGLFDAIKHIGNIAVSDEADYFLIGLNGEILIESSFDVVTIIDTDVLQTEVTIYPALKDAIIAEQNRLTDEDYQTIAITVSQAIGLLTDEFADAQTVVDFIEGSKRGMGEDISGATIRLMQVQKKLYNHKVIADNLPYPIAPLGLGYY
jgi:hypothetical protein